MQRHTCRRFFAATLALVLLGGCVQTAPDIPPPPAEVAMRTAPPLPASVLDVPVEVDLGLLRERLERKVPRKIDHEASWDRDGNSGLRYRVERGPFEVSFVDGELRVRSELRYRARVCVGFGRVCQPVASCGYDDNGMRRLDVMLASPVGLTPAWKLKTSTREAHRLVDPCKVTFLRVDVSKKVDRLLTKKLAPLLSLLDRELAQAADVRTHAKNAWEKLQDPIEIRHDLWLVLAPEAARVSTPRRRGKKVRFVLGITGRPRLIAGARPEPERRPLPRLERAQRPGGFSLYVQAEVPYEEATHLLREAIAGQRFDAGGHRIVIRDVKITGGGRYGGVITLELEAERGLFRRVRGTVHVDARPSYDPERGELALSELDYAVDSQDLPVQVAEALLRPEVLDYLRENANWSVGQRLEEARLIADRELDRELAPGIRLAGKLDRLEPIEVVAESDRFVASVAAIGKASLSISPEAGRGRGRGRGRPQP